MILIFNMKITEQILTGIAFIGIILKYLNIPGELFILVMSLLLLGMFHYIFGFALANKIPLKKLMNKEYYSENKIGTDKIIVAIFWGWSLSIVDIAIIFNFGNWPGNSVMSLSGFSAVISIGLVMFFINKGRKNIQKENLIRLLVAIVLLAIAVFTNK